MIGMSINLGVFVKLGFMGLEIRGFSIEFVELNESYVKFRDF